MLELLDQNKDIIHDSFVKFNPNFFDKEVELRSTDELIDICNTLDYRKLTYKEKLSPHGCKMVKFILEENRIVDFIKLWR